MLIVMLTPYFLALAVRSSPEWRDIYIASGELLRSVSLSNFISAAEIARAMRGPDSEAARLGLAFFDWLGFLVVFALVASIVATFWGTVRGPARHWPAHRISDERLGVFARPALFVVIGWLLFETEAFSGSNYGKYDSGFLVSLVALLIVAAATLPVMRVWGWSIKPDQE